MPRPAPQHANAEGGVLEELRGPFQRGRGGPGGWWILPEPELHFPDPEAPGEIEALVPDVAGWRTERMTKLPKDVFSENAVPIPVRLPIAAEVIQTATVPEVANVIQLGP